jgi:hypothetical protein
MRIACRIGLPADIIALSGGNNLKQRRHLADLERP